MNGCLDWCERGWEAVHGVLIFIIIATILLFSFGMLGGIFTTMFSTLATSIGGMTSDIGSALSLTEMFPNIEAAFPFAGVGGQITDAVNSFPTDLNGMEDMLTGVSDKIMSLVPFQ